MSSKRKHRSEDEEEDREMSEEEREDSRDEDFDQPSPKKKRKTKGKAGPKKKKNQKRGAASGASSASEGEDNGEQAEGGNKTKKKQPKNKRKKAATEDEDEEEEDSSLFGMVKNRTAMAVTVAEWISRYQEDATEAMRELLNFILKSCGYPDEVSKTAYRKQEIGKILEDILNDQKYRAEGGDYPIVGRGRFRKFKSNFLEFWDKLINKTQYTLVYEEAFLGNLVTIAVVISSSALRPLRHTATLLGLQLMTSLIKLANNLSKELQVTMRQHKAAKNKAGSKSSKSEAAKVRELQEKAEDLKDKINSLEESMAQIFKGIFVHRYRDIFSGIRAECISSLGEWIKTYPIYFMNDIYLKYMGWALSDRNAVVRLSAIRALSSLYENDENITPLDYFTSRFKARMVACTLDKELSVSLAAIELSTRLAKVGALGEDDTKQLNSLLSDSNVKIRFAAAEYLNEAVLQSVIPDTEDKKAKHKVQLKELLSFVMKQTYQPKNPNYVIDALWEQTSVVKAWDAMSQLMVDEELEANERAVLASMVNACVKKASGLSICPKEKSDPNATIKPKEKAANQAKFSKHFAKRLPELLEHCKTEPDQIEELIELPQYFDFDAYHTHRYEKHFQSLLEQLHEIYLNNSRPSLLQTCAKTYRAMLTQEHAMRKDAEVAFGRLTDELADRFLQNLPSFDPAEGPTELSEEQEYALRMALGRIYYLYCVLDLARLDLYDPVRGILNAQISGQFPSRYEKVMVFAVGVMGQHLLWSAAKFKPKTDEPTQIAHERDELIHQLTKLLEKDVAAPDVRDKAYMLLCDLSLIFRPGLKHKAQGKLTTPLGTLPATLRAYFEEAMDVPRERKTKDAEEEEEDDEDEEEEEELEDKRKAKKKRKSKTDDEEEQQPKSKRGKKKGKKSDQEDEDEDEEREKARKRKARRRAEEDEPVITPEEESKERRERPLTKHETIERKIRLISGLAKLVVYNVIPRAENASSLLVHFVRHGKQVKATLRQFLAQLKAGDENVQEDTAKTWVIILDSMKKEYRAYLDATDGVKSIVLDDFKELSLRLALTFGVAHKKVRNSLITLVHSGIMYAAEDIPANLHFLDGLPRFVSSLATSQTTAKYILKTFEEEMKDRYAFDKSEPECDPYFAFLAHLQKVAKVGDEEIDEDELLGVGAAKKATGKGKGKKKKKTSRIPALEFEKVPDRPKSSKTASLRVADINEDGEGEEEGGASGEEDALVRKGKTASSKRGTKRSRTAERDE